MKQKLKQTKSITDSIRALCPLSSPQNHCPQIQRLSTNYNPPQNNNNKIQNEKETKTKISIKNYNALTLTMKTPLPIRANGRHIVNIS
jgi:hypothetical protein